MSSTNEGTLAEVTEQVTDQVIAESPVSEYQDEEAEFVDAEEYRKHLQTIGGTHKKRSLDLHEQEHLPPPKRQKPSNTGLYSATSHIQNWVTVVSCPEMEHLLARPKDSRGRKRRAPSSTGSLLPADRLDQTCSYHDTRYRMLLEENESFLSDSPNGLNPASIQHLDNLLSHDPSDIDPTLLNKERFKAVISLTEDRNEPRVSRDVTPLLVPSAEILCSMGIIAEDYLIETLDEGWNSCFPITSPRPQPDFSVGFKRKAFTGTELEILLPYIGNSSSKIQSYFLATHLMCFPFLTCEAKCGGAGLDEADRQNGHSMTVAVRSVMELFRSAQCLGDVQREILGFSFSHDAQCIRFYAHYFDVVDTTVRYYRHKIRSFDFTDQEWKDRQTAYKFVRGIYSDWVPTHLARIKTAIALLPKLACNIEDSGLHSQSHSIVSQSDIGSSSELDVSPDTPASEGSAKRVKKLAAAG